MLREADIRQVQLQVLASLPLSSLPWPAIPLFCSIGYWRWCGMTE